MEIDIHLNGTWAHCATVELQDPLRPSTRDRVVIRYDADYALEHLYRQGAEALSVRWPVDLAVRKIGHWPAFLVDLLPQGEARARHERQVAGAGDRVVDGDGVNGGAVNDWTLLQRAAVNPVGNFRMRPSTPRARGTHPGFELEEIAAQGPRFVDYAAEAGAQVIGATDVAGDSPKFWAVQTDEGRWLPDDGRWGDRARRHMLIKFPDPAAGPQATEVLRLEAAYQRVAQQLGLFAAPELPQFINGLLLIHRFDRRRGAEGEVRLGVESLRSIAGARVGQELTHLDALLALRDCVSDFERDLLEYIRRDVLNLALGNRDNEPGNSAVLKEVDGSIRLAPLYDFGPAFLDSRRTLRVMRWEGEGDTPMDWSTILASIAARFSSAQRDPGDLRTLAERLRAFAQDLERLPHVMGDCGVDEAIIQQRRRPIDALTRVLGELRYP